MSKRPASKQATGINSLVEQILASKGYDKKLQQYRAWAIWDEVVGPQIARHAQPLRIRESILEVRVENPTWMQQLQLLKPKILKELNGRLGETSLSDIYWKRGKIEKEEIPKTVEPELPPLSAEHAANIEKLTCAITDSELRQRLKQLLIQAARHEQQDAADQE